MKKHRDKEWKELIAIAEQLYKLDMMIKSVPDKIWELADKLQNIKQKNEKERRI